MKQTINFYEFTMAFSRAGRENHENDKTRSRFGHVPRFRSRRVRRRVVKEGGTGCSKVESAPGYVGQEIVHVTYRVQTSKAVRVLFHDRRRVLETVHFKFLGRDVVSG